MQIKWGRGGGQVGFRVWGSGSGVGAGVIVVVIEEFSGEGLTLTIQLCAGRV